MDCPVRDFGKSLVMRHYDKSLPQTVPQIEEQLM